MGGPLSRGRVAALAVVLTVSGVLPLHTAGGADAPEGDTPSAQPAYWAGDAAFQDPVEPVVPFRDGEARIRIVPPSGWLQSPATSLDRAADEETYEVARYQVTLTDPALYAQPVPVTSGLLADATAILSLSLAREGGSLIGADLSLVDPEAVHHRASLDHLDGETSYDGVVTFTRILVARDTGRALVVRAYVRSADRGAFAATVLAAIGTATLDPFGPNGPRYVAPAPPAPPAPEPDATAASLPDQSAEMRAQIIARASAMLGTPYVWGGNWAGHGMDCSAYVSAAWGLSRYTTDSLWGVAVPVAKSELLPGDAMDLETWRDPAGYGHVRLFDAWANDAHTLVWVYEETPPRAIHRVIAYDASYRPMRLVGLSADGVAPLVPAPAATAVPRFGPAQPVPTRRGTATPRPTWRPTAAWTPQPTPRPTVRPTPTPTPRPTATARSTVQTSIPTARFTPSPTRR